MNETPDAVLFACTHNSVRSPMGESLLKHLLGHQISVDSIGVSPPEIDPYVVAVLDAHGIDLTRHRAKAFDDLEDTSYDLIISLSPEAQHSAVELTRTMACEVEFWNTFDPSMIEGNRDTRLDAYRQVRDFLRRRIENRFTLDLKPDL